MATPLAECCPEGYTYIYSNGTYYDSSINGYPTILNNAFTSPTFNDVIGKCGHFVNTGFVGTTDPLTTPATVPGEDCPCCPDGYTYSQFLGTCWKGNASQITPPIPCIPCICEDPVPPQECETCNESSGQPIHFALNPFMKQCVDCVPQGYYQTNDPKLNCFMPYFLILPNTNQFTKE